MLVVRAAGVGETEAEEAGKSGESIGQGEGSW